MVAGLSDGRDRQHLGCLAGADDESAGNADGSRAAAFERVQTRLQGALRRVHDARVDVADLGEGEEVGRVRGVAELVAGRLIDRDRPCTGAGVGVSPDMDLACLETPCITHGGARYVLNPDQSSRNSRPDVFAPMHLSNRPRPKEAGMFQRTRWSAVGAAVAVVL